MSGSQQDLDALRQLWPAAERLPDREVQALAERIRKKDRAIRASMRAETGGGAVAASLLMGLLTAGAAARAVWFWAQIGYLLCALGCLVAFVVVWLYRRHERNSPQLGLEMREYYDQLIRFHDLQIRFLQTSKYWYVGPVLVGVALIGWSMWIETGNQITSVLVGVVIPLVAAVFIYYQNDVRAVGDLRARRAQIQEWMSDLVRGMDAGR
jgi:MFS family permease